MNSYLVAFVATLLLAVLKIVCLLIAIAYFTLAERKIMAAVQRRVGPNVVGPFGLLQPLADGLKLAGKELAVPAQASSRIFLAASGSVLFIAFCSWAAVPFGMFDHSVCMGVGTVVEILAYTDR
jgi:NADH-quinone oxidoreductase subunit H